MQLLCFSGVKIFTDSWRFLQTITCHLFSDLQVKACVEIARDAVAAGKCVVIGLQSTGEAKTLEALDDAGGELTEFVSTAKAVLASLIDKHFPMGDGSNAASNIYADFDKLCDDMDNVPKRNVMKRRSTSSFFEIPTKQHKFDVDDDESSAEDEGQAVRLELKCKQKEKGEKVGGAFESGSEGIKSHISEHSA